MNPQDFINQIEKFKQELESDVIWHYRQNDRDRGGIAFKNWRDRVSKFLNKYTEKKGDELISLTTHLMAVASRRKSIYQDFMDRDGGATFAFLEELISTTSKGNLVIAEQIETKNNSEKIEVKNNNEKNTGSNENSRIHDWFNEKSWFWALISSIILFIFSFGWYLSEKSFEPAIASLGFFFSIIAIIFNRGIKGLIFIFGLLVGIISTVVLFYLFPQSNTNSVKADNKAIIEKNKNTNLGNTNSEIGNKDSSLNSAQTRILPDGRILVDITPESLESFFEKNTDIQARKLLEVYVGKWIITTGKVREVTNRTDKKSFIVLGREDDKGYQPVLLIFKDPKQIEQIQTLKLDNNIKVLGQIAVGDARPAVYLDNCELVE